MELRAQIPKRNEISAESMRIHSYIIDHDLGFAPNPFFGVCTLAACKPKIRKYAQIGDYVIGTGSKPNKLNGHIIYWMKIEDIVDINEYWHSDEFQSKKPIMKGSRMQRYGDNIYYRDESGNINQVNSFHSLESGDSCPDNLKRDTSTTQNVLMGKEFIYWGQDAPRIPDELSNFVVTTQGHKNRFSEEQKAQMLKFLHSFPERGFVGRPANWP